MPSPKPPGALVALLLVTLSLAACGHRSGAVARVSASDRGGAPPDVAPGAPADAQVRTRARPPVQPWERGYLSRRAMRFDDGLEAWFNQHMFASREGADGAYGMVGGGCGCN